MELTSKADLKKPIFLITILLPLLVMEIIPSFSASTDSRLDYKIELDEKTIYLVGPSSLKIYSKLADHFGREKVKFSDKLEDLKGRRVNIIISYSNDLYKSNQTPVQIIDILEENKDRGVMLVTLSDEKVGDKFRDVLGAFLKATRGEIPIEIVDLTDYGKHRGEALQWDQRIYEAQIVAFSINPFGWFIAEETGDLMETLLFTIRKFVERPQHKQVIGCSIENAPDGLMGSITQNGFNWIGYVGWKTKDIKGYLGDTVGKMYVYVEYYYTSQKVGSTTYKFFIAHVQHSMEGYGTLLAFHYPSEFITETNWMTSTYSGQVLKDWGPKNSGGPTSSVSFGLSVGLSGVSATISYTVPAYTTISWADQTTPSSGKVRTKHTLSDSKTHVTYTIEPSSIGFLDPNKPGGFEPMLISHYMKSTLKANILDEWADLSFSVALRSSGVSQTG